jgi:glucose/arabinose dehydrogenase
MRRTTRLYWVALVLSLILLGGTTVFNPAASAHQPEAGRAPQVAAPVVPADGTEALPPGAVIQTVLSNMTYPIAMAFDPQGRLFYTEKTTGNVRLFANGVLQVNPVITFTVDNCSERGLLGIAVDPQFNSNHYIYVYYTAASGCGNTTNNVARFVESNGAGSNPAIIFSSPQTAGNHNGGNIHFGPDGKLYIIIGENANPANSQDVTAKNGKMHRINADGTIPADNPVFTQTGALPSLYAMGLRNSFDFTFDPLDTTAPYRIFASENGPTCDDELNRIEPAYNYGWRPSYPCDDASPSPTYNTIPPLWFVPNGACCIAPTGITVYTGYQIPQWQNQLFMASYNDSVFHHFYLNAGRTLVTAANAVQGVTANTDIETGPDGALWYIEGGGYSTGTLKRIVAPVLRGHVTWEGRPAQPNALNQLPITLTLRLGATSTSYPNLSADASGVFTVPVSTLPNGDYTWWAKGPQYQATSGTVSLSGA